MKDKRQNETKVEQLCDDYCSDNWFAGTRVEENCIEYVGRTDERETNGEKNIYKGFTLSFYSVFRGN